MVTLLLAFMNIFTQTKSLEVLVFKKSLKKISSLVLTFAVLLTGILFVPQAGSAAEAAAVYYLPSSYKNMVFYAAPDDLPATFVTLRVCRKGSSKKPRPSSIQALTSSDSSIARPYINKDGDIRVYFFKKAGTADITFQIGSQKLKSTITVKNYSNPLRSFKVGKKNFTSRFQSATECNYFHSSTLKNQLVSAKAAKGWKITSMKLQYGSGSYEISSCSKSSFAKKVTFDGDLDYVTFTMRNTKTKAYVTLTWNCIKE